jgi:hypothetical protein
MASPAPLEGEPCEHHRGGIGAVRKAEVQEPPLATQ